MWDIGDCLTCTKLGTCTETNLQRVLDSYTCPLFEPVVEPIYLARISMMQKYGDIEAVSSMIRPDMNLEEDP
jgi:hypothetical protein